MIDERIKMEQEKKLKGMETILSDDVLRNTVISFHDEDELNMTRTRGYTSDYVQREAMRMAKGDRHAVRKDEDFLPKAKRGDFDTSMDSIRSK